MTQDRQLSETPVTLPTGQPIANVPPYYADVVFLVIILSLLNKR